MHNMSLSVMQVRFQSAGRYGTWKRTIQTNGICTFWRLQTSKLLTKTNSYRTIRLLVSGRRHFDIISMDWLKCQRTSLKVGLNRYPWPSIHLLGWWQRCTEDWLLHSYLDLVPDLAPPVSLPLRSKSRRYAVRSSQIQSPSLLEDEIAIPLKLHAQLMFI